jgi:hypothetical protein
VFLCYLGEFGLQSIKTMIRCFDVTHKMSHKRRVWVGASSRNLVLYTPALGSHDHYYFSLRNNKMLCEN